MGMYLTLKQAIRFGDIGLIRRLFPRYAPFFFGGNRLKYGNLSLYMTWLTETDAATDQLKTAILTNGLVNLRSPSDSWFEMDRLNEFLNLEMKRIMTSRRTSTQTLEELFRRTALTSSYMIELQAQM